jgi:hypothetical protein
MKKLILMLALTGILLSPSCKKEDPITPVKKFMEAFPFVGVSNLSTYILYLQNNPIDTATTLKIVSELEGNYEVELSFIGQQESTILTTDGIWLYRYDKGETIASAIRIYKKNGTQGESWTDVLDGDSIVNTITHAGMTKVVHAGSFVVDRVIQYAIGSTDTSVVFINPEEGIIAQEFVAGPLSFSLELYSKNF